MGERANETPNDSLGPVFRVTRQIRLHPAARFGLYLLKCAVRVHSMNVWQIGYDNPLGKLQIDERRRDTVMAVRHAIAPSQVFLDIRRKCGVANVGTHYARIKKTSLLWCPTMQHN